MKKFFELRVPQLLFMRSKSMATNVKSSFNHGSFLDLDKDTRIEMINKLLETNCKT